MIFAILLKKYSAIISLVAAREQQRKRKKLLTRFDNFDIINERRKRATNDL